MRTIDVFDERWTQRTGTCGIMGLPRDPQSLFVYWEVDDDRKWLIERHFQSSWGVLPQFLCVYDVTNVWFDGYNAPLVRRIRVNSDANRWHVYGLRPDCNYVIDLATTTVDDRQFSILRSNVVPLPPSKASFCCPNTAFLPVIANDSQSYPYESTFDGYHIHA